VSISGQSGIDEALSGLPDRVRALGEYVQEGGHSVFELPQNLAQRIDNPLYSIPTRDSVITYQTAGDTGLNVYHLAPQIIPFDLGFELSDNPAVTSQPTLIDEYRVLERQQSTFEPVPLLRGVPPDEARQMQALVAPDRFQASSPTSPSNFFTSIVRTMTTAWQTFWHSIFRNGVLSLFR
jgi:hypothetical protein